MMLFIPSYSQELGHVVCRDKLDMLSTGTSFRVPDAPRNVKGISSHSRQWLVRLRNFRKQESVEVRVSTASFCTTGMALSDMQMMEMK
jgi:hypothetical protein